MGARSSFSDTAAESHLNLSNSDRCLMSGNAGPPMTPGGGVGARKQVFVAALAIVTAEGA
jgi:hypothetical protein